MTNHLFTYGTLLSGARAHRLQPFALEIRPASIAGTLYHTGYGFPVVHVGGEGLVVGQLVSLREPQKALAAMDCYEGINGSLGLYRRVEVDAALNGGGSERTWVYAVIPERLADISGLVEVADGDWLAFLSQRKAPWMFGKIQA